MTNSKCRCRREAIEHMIVRSEEITQRTMNEPGLVISVFIIINIKLGGLSQWIGLIINYDNSSVLKSDLSSSINHIEQVE
jgi:hypothetical protein